MVIRKNGLWRISNSGRLDDWESALANGFTNTCSDPEGPFVVWRYGSWIPEVVCSHQGDHVVVTTRAKAALSFTRATFRRVQSLFVTDPDVDPRAWPDSTVALAAIGERHDIGEPEEICCPSGAAFVPDAATSLGELRRGLVQIRDPDLWVVFGEESLEARRPERHAVGKPGAGIYRDPFLFRGNVCVEDRVRAVLETFGALATIEFRGLDVDWQ